LYRTNFAKINNIGTTDNFSVRVLPYVLRNGTSGDTIRTSNVNRTWMIDEDIAGGSNGTVEMFWNASDELPGFDRTASRTAHFISNWQLSNPGNASVDTNGIFSREQAGYTSFSPFTVTSGTTVLIPITIHRIYSGSKWQGCVTKMDYRSGTEYLSFRCRIQYRWSRLYCNRKSEQREYRRRASVRVYASVATRQHSVLPDPTS
jgi:hypothetical protein